MNTKEIERAFKKAVTKQDAHQLAKLFHLPPPNPSSQKAAIAESRVVVDGTDYSNVVNALLHAMVESEVGDATACFKAQITLHTNFNRLYASSTGNWMVPALLEICKNTRAFGCKTGDPDNSAANLLQQSFANSRNHRVEYDPNAPFDADGSKKAAALRIANELFALYFRLNQPRLCKTVIGPVEQKKLHLKGPMSDMVTYRYYVGRLQMSQDAHAEAEESLEYAFKHCHKASFHNKRCILKYLIPVKLVRGKVPTAELLDKYNIQEYKPIVEGVRKGDLRTFQNGLVQYMGKFIQQGTYLLLEKCKMEVYRNLFKRVYAIVGDTRIPLDTLSVAFKWLDVPIDHDEIECILANLIYKKVIRGYISHTKRTLVLSKRDPFPEKPTNE